MKKRLLTMAAAVFALSMLLGATCLAKEFDANFYAKTYPDVVNALGSDATVLYNHYVTSGQSEGRLPYEGAAKGESVEAPNPNATVETPQPAVAKTYDLRNLKTLFNEQGWSLPSQWFTVFQNTINEVINDPLSHLQGNTTIDRYLYFETPVGAEIYDCFDFELAKGNMMLRIMYLRNWDRRTFFGTSMTIYDYSAKPLHVYNVYFRPDGSVENIDVDN